MGVKETSEESSGDGDTAGEKKAPAVQYVHTTDMPEVLASLNLSLLISTYQAQRIMTISSTGERLFMLMRVFERPTGISHKERSMALMTKRQVWFFEDSGHVQNLDGDALPYDLNYVPRRSHVTGDISGHELGWHNDEMIIVNTRFSCLCKLDPAWSFVPYWTPPFVSKVAPEDRCHLNGMVMDSKGPKYVTALGETDTEEGWRENKVKGGVIVDVPSGEVVSRGIAMPHSPRLHAGRLWVLESGTGSLQVVDPKDGKRTTVVQLPGYLRGLAFFDRYAFVGSCKTRGDRETFGGMPIEEMVDVLKCAVYLVDISRGEVLGFIEFTKGIEELFDVHVLPGVRNPHIIGFEEETLDGLFVVNI